MCLSQSILVFVAFASSGVHGFGVYSPLQHAKLSALAGANSQETRLFGIRCENKYYQLEEMEDQENCTTELFLKADGTIEIGETDGPLWATAKGSWAIKPGTDDFTMSIVKTFQTGSDARDMGEFSFQVVRNFEGDMTQVGESVAITGVMKSGTADSGLNGDSHGDDEDAQEVGFFNMIDGTDVRKDARLDARVGKQGEDPTKIDEKNDATATHKGLDEETASKIAAKKSAAAAAANQFSYQQQPQAQTSDQSFSYLSMGQTQQQQPQQQSDQSFSYLSTGQTQQSQPQQQQSDQSFSYLSMGQETQQQQPQAADALPEGWSEEYDPAQNKNYYYNRLTGASQWEKPTAAPAQNQPLPQGWVEQFDPAQQATYYYNQMTGVSQWERPQ